MLYHTNAEIVRHYFKELMYDEEAHTMSEIITYIHEKYGEIGINGSPLSYATVNNAIRKLVNAKNEYSIVGRGVFKKQQNYMDNTVSIIYENMRRILRKTEDDIRKNFVEYLDITQMSDESLFALQQAGRDVFSHLAQAEQIVRNLQDSQTEEMCHAQEESPENCFAMHELT